KETTAEQNALAIRTLSALGVPTRFTYITFDHLMTDAELRGTYEFQARRDLLLKPLPHLTTDEIVYGVRDESFVAEHTVDRPFYAEISYMLVSMECLIGASYTRQVESKRLAGLARPSMGRVDASFQDWRIGRCSYHAQLWVDRNFALDYTLKSLEKIFDGELRHVVRAARRTIKESAFSLLGIMIRLVDSYETDVQRSHDLDSLLVAAMERELDYLRDRIEDVIQLTILRLPSPARDLLIREWSRWSEITDWRLINAADPCGT